MKLGDDAYFELSFSPNERLVSMVRRFVTNFYEQILEDGDLTSRVGVATHELLDNAVRYSTDGQSRVRVSIRRHAPNKLTVSIQTWNRTNRDHIAKLAALMDEIRAVTDVDAYYQTLMQRSAKRTDGSGLGLGRIRAEAEMTVTHRIEGEEVQLVAEGLFESAGGKA